MQINKIFSTFVISTSIKSPTFKFNASIEKFRNLGISYKKDENSYKSILIRNLLDSIVFQKFYFLFQ